LTNAKIHPATLPQKPKWPLRHVQPKHPGDLFILSEPFQPVIPIKPSARNGCRDDSGGRDIRKKAVFLGVNLLGDFLCTTPVIRSYKKRHPDTFVIYIVQNAPFCHIIDDNPDIDLIIYNEQLYIYGERVYSEEWLHSLPIEFETETNLYRFNIHELCRTTPSVFREHISIGFSKFLNIPIDSVRPTIHLTPQEHRIARAFIRRPYIVFSMNAVSKVIDEKGKLALKNWPEERWRELAKEIHSWDRFDIIAIGAEISVRPEVEHVRNLYGLPIKIVAALCKGAACVVTVEGGISHLCHGIDAPMVVVCSKYVAYHWVFPKTASCFRFL
jgi:ADP-heptose:LPS heptosyltransferase